MANEPRHEKTFCVCENKGAEQIRGNCEAGRRLCFRYTDSILPLLFKPLAIFCICTARFVSDVFGNHIVVFFLSRLKCSCSSVLGLFLFLPGCRWCHFTKYQGLPLARAMLKYSVLQKLSMQYAAIFFELFLSFKN